MIDTLTLLWRQGRGRLKETSVYARGGTDPRPEDELVAVAATPELAAHIASMHNMHVLFGSHEPARP